jgi:DNA replication licensing factor MCM4
VLDEKASDKLVEAYSDMRKLGNNKKIITATTRQLESLIRISEAFAKMRLSSVVEEKDVDQAVALVKFATQQAATDP